MSIEIPDNNARKTSRGQRKGLRYFLIFGLLSVFLGLAIAIVGIGGEFIPHPHRHAVVRWLVELAVGASIGLAAMVVVDVYEKGKEVSEARERDIKEERDRLERDFETKRQDLKREGQEHRDRVARDIAHLEDEKRRLAGMDASIQAVSRYLRVTKRVDELRVSPAGDGDLTWRFDVENVDSGNDFDLKIYSEHDTIPPLGTVPASNVKVTHLEIGGKADTQAGDSYRVTEIRYPNRKSANPIEFGVIKVRLNNRDIADRGPIPIAVGTTFRGTFFNAAKDGDYFVVEIPQLTEHISVTLASSDPAYRVALPRTDEESILVARMGYAGPVDPVETNARRSEVRTPDGQLVWKGMYPKLGYQYQLKFRLVPN